jgi:hypothetical protein
MSKNKHAAISQAECRSFEAIDLHSVGLNRPSWHTNLHNPFYFISQQILQTTEIDQQSLFQQLPSFLLHFMRCIQAGRNSLVPNSVASNSVLPCHLTFTDILNATNYTVLEMKNFQESALNLTNTTPLGY